MPTKKISPMKATFAQICRMKTNHHSTGDFTLMTDGYSVWLSEQGMGEEPEQRFEMTRLQFNRTKVTR